jgi:hypothetical protein
MVKGKILNLSNQVKTETPRMSNLMRGNLANKSFEKVRGWEGENERSKEVND